MQPRRTMPKKFSTWILNRIARFKLWTENCTSILGFAAVKFAAFSSVSMFTRFDRWSLSAVAMLYQLSPT